MYLVVLVFSILHQVVDSERWSTRNSTRAGDPRRTVLVTGVGMAKGLTLARGFGLSGHRVIGADFEDYIMSCSGRFSKSLSAFRQLPRPDGPTHATAYTTLLKQIIKDEGVDLWVSCSGVASAIEDAQAKEAIEQQTTCKCVQFDVATTSTLHAKNTFMRVCAERGLQIPDTHDVTSQAEVLRVLSELQLSHPGRKHILKPVGVNDINRGDMVPLPLNSNSKTKEYISRLPISPATPWILQHFIPGDEEYCTHALVVRGELKCFVVCPSSELLMHYVPLSRNDARWHVMLDFTLQFLDRSDNAVAMTGHLSFDFKVESRTDIYVIECNPRAHTAVVLFAQQGREMQDMVEAYLSVLERPVDASAYTPSVDAKGSGGQRSLVVPPEKARPRYWIGHDLVAMLLRPLLHLATGSITFMDFSTSSLAFLEHLFNWKEGSFEVWDPLPAIILYHVYWPLTILSAWWRGLRWSRVNVSTTKMFTC